MYAVHVALVPPSEDIFSVKHLTDGADHQTVSMHCSIILFQIYCSFERHLLCLYICLSSHMADLEGKHLNDVADSVAFIFTVFFALQRQVLSDI